MRLIEHNVTGETQCVESTDGYDPAEWTDRGDVPAEIEPQDAVWDGDAVAADLSRLEMDLIARIDAEAEAVRLRFITPGAGQAMEYQEALTQARAFADGGAGTYPMLAADVAAGTIDPRTGEAVADEAQAADLVLWSYAQWIAAGSAIREARLAAKAAVREATTREAKVAATQVDWEAITS